MLATVDVVTEEEVVGLGREAAVLEQAEEVVVLAVDVAADLDGRLEFEEDGLVDEDLAGLGAEELDLKLLQLDLLAGPVAADCASSVPAKWPYDGGATHPPASGQ